MLPGSHLIPVLLSRKKPLLLPFVAFSTLVVSVILATKGYAVKKNGSTSTMPYGSVGPSQQASQGAAGRAGPHHDGVVVHETRRLSECPLSPFMVRQAHHERRCAGTSNRSP